MELKTLKDIRFSIPGNKTEKSLAKTYIKEKLKYEAFKWYYSDEVNNCDSAVRKWIVHFFNLKERDGE